jgi:2-haloacid dehalogenase
MRVIVFDVNETLLDLRALDPLFVEWFGDASYRTSWFGQMLQIAFVGGLSGSFISFTDAQGAALRILGKRAGIEVEERLLVVLAAMRHLPAHGDVTQGLDLLRGAGIRLGALANSPLDVVEDQLVNAQLRDYFEHVISAEEVRALKPAPQPYVLAAHRFGVDPAGLRLVAAHGWDIAGALSAGCAAAFLERPGASLIPIGAQPDVVAGDMKALCGALLERGG